MVKVKELKLPFKGWRHRVGVEEGELPGPATLAMKKYIHRG